MLIESFKPTSRFVSALSEDESLDDERDERVSAGASGAVEPVAGDETRPAKKPPTPMRMRAARAVMGVSFINLADGIFLTPP